MRLLIRWLINAISLLIVAHFVSGFHVDRFTSALLAAIVLGLGEEEPPFDENAERGEEGGHDCGEGGRPAMGGERNEIEN